MSEREEMEVFLREMLMNIESEQSQIIRKLEDCHRNIESLNREKIIVEEKLKDNISFFNPSCGKNREKLDQINQKILDGHSEISRVKENLKTINDKIVIMGKILNFIHEKKEDVKEEKIDIKSGISILETQEKERKRIARELHDTTVQSLTSIVDKAEYCSKMIEKDPIQVKLELINMMNAVKNSIDEMRRSIYDLRPMTTDDFELISNIQRFINQNKEIYKNIDFQIHVKQEKKDIKLPSIVSLTIFRIIQEACNNIFKHANAKQVTIDINYDKEDIEVLIEDDGVGFSMEKIRKEDNAGFGLSIMKERAQLSGGTIAVESEEGVGTILSVRIPYSVINEV